MFLRVCFFEGSREKDTFLLDLVPLCFKLDFRLLNKKKTLLSGWKMKMDGGIAISEMNGIVLKNWALLGSIVWMFSGSKSTKKRESSVKT
jgi:hypothetical protein